MIWKKNIYDSLTDCATLCDEFATECSRFNDIESWYRSIFLSLDCADVCRQLAMLYVRGSENAGLLAKACIEVCEKCAQEVGGFDTQRCKQMHVSCRQAILSCAGILEMAHHTDVSKIPNTISVSLFRRTDLRETLYN